MDELDTNEITDASNDGVGTAAESAQTAQPKDRVSSTVSLSDQTVTITTAAGSTAYKLGDIPIEHHGYLVLDGLRRNLIGAGDNAPKKFDELKRGQFSSRAPAKGDKPVDNKRKAIALALVDATKKTPEPLSLDAATAKAAALDRNQVSDFMRDPKVLAHYNKLVSPQGGAPSVLQLVQPKAEADNQAEAAAA